MDNKISLATFRLLARELSEEFLIENIKEQFENYEKSKSNKEKIKLMQYLTFLVAKWNDELQGDTTDDKIIKSSVNFEEKLKFNKSLDDLLNNEN